MKVKIKNTKKNKIYLIIGRLTTVVVVWGLLVQVNVKILDFIINNCITTL